MMKYSHLIYVCEYSIVDFEVPKDRMIQVLKWYLSAFHAGRKVLDKMRSVLDCTVNLCVPLCELIRDVINSSSSVVAHTKTLMESTHA